MSKVGPGTVIDGRYEIVSRLGTGGMGVVYLARQLALGRDVAVKMLRADVAPAPEDRVRFRREARIMSKLRHEHAVEIYDYGDFEGQAYLVMERLSGVTLRHRMTPGTPFQRQKLLEIAYQVADVLVAAHDLAIVHRDLKPENIMLERRADGSTRAVVVDFGLAFLQRGTPDLGRVTVKSLTSGTPQYMSPEQARAREDLGPKTDLYSLGCVIWELVAAEPVFAAEKPVDIVNMHMYAPPRRLRDVRPDDDVPSVLDDLVHAMLQKDPHDRPTAFEARERLGQLIVGRIPRDRGRPEKLSQVRGERAITASGGARGSVPLSDQPAPAGPEPRGAATARYPLAEPQAPSQAAATEDLVGVHVRGELGVATLVALRAAGLDVVDDAAEADVVWMLADVAEDPTAFAVPVVATRPVGDAEALAGYVREGFADLVAPDADHATVVKKLLRAARRSSSRRPR